MAQWNDPASTELVSLGDEQQVLEVVTSTAYKLWEAVNKLTRCGRRSGRAIRVTIFESARAPGDHWVYQVVRDLAAELARLDRVIVTGGGPGLMKAGVHITNPAASEGSVGIRVDLPVRFLGSD